YFVHIAKKLGRFTLVGIPPFHTAEPWVEQAIFRRTLVNCDAVTVNTAYEADIVRKRGGPRVETCRVGIDPTSFLNTVTAANRLRTSGRWTNCPDALDQHERTVPNLSSRRGCLTSGALCAWKKTGP